MQIIQLYDLKVDGAETNNIIDHASLAHVIHRLRQIMADYIETVACPKTANHSVLNKEETEETLDEQHKVDTKWSWLKYLVM